MRQCCVKCRCLTCCTYPRDLVHERPCAVDEQEKGGGRGVGQERVAMQYSVRSRGNCHCNCLQSIGHCRACRSQVCWHVYGVIHKQNRNHAEALKCFRNALRIEKDNQQLLRDMGYEQIQCRDLKGFQETRRQLLQLKPETSSNWWAFAIANHLCGNHEMAAQVGLIAVWYTLSFGITTSFFLWCFNCCCCCCCCCYVCCCYWWSRSCKRMSQARARKKGRIWKPMRWCCIERRFCWIPSNMPALWRHLR